jgi:hypothetical protein
LFVSNVLSCPSSVAEALNVGIFCLAIVDTNVTSQAISIAVPGNDESLYSIAFYNELICNYILLWKFKSIILWFSNVRNYKRLRSINKFTYDILNQSYNKTVFNQNSVFFNSLRFVFSKNTLLSNINPIFKGCYSSAEDLSILKNILNKNLRLFFFISR